MKIYHLFPKTIINAKNIYSTDKVKDFDAKTKDLEEAVGELQILHKNALEDCSKLEQDLKLKNHQHQQEILKRDITIREMATEMEELKSTLNSLGNQGSSVFYLWLNEVKNFSSFNETFTFRCYF